MLSHLRITEQQECKVAGNANNKRKWEGNHNGQCTIKDGNCKKVGHMTRECRNPTVARNQRTHTCYKCGSLKHFKRRRGEGNIMAESFHCVLNATIIMMVLVLPKMPPDRLYLSSTSSTMIVDDEQIPVLKQFKSDDSGIELAKELLPADSTSAKAETLENLLMWACNQKYDTATFHCAVRIDKIRTKRGWNYPSCGDEKCKKGNLDCKNGRFWCDSCHSSVDCPVLRYKLELEVLDDTAQVVVVMFDKTARTVVKCLVGSIMRSEEQERHDSDGEESFVADCKTKGTNVACSSEAGKRRRLVLDSSE
ncbi:nucleic acid-binding, OB-fold protein [Tanacetum coccineum]